MIEPGATTGIGSLPHLSAHQAAEFSWNAFDVPTIPSLPRRSPAESEIARALMGVEGVALGQYGSFVVDADLLDPHASVDTDVDSLQFTGFRTFVELAASRDVSRPVMWEFAGPISVGLALIRAGAEPRRAFAVAHSAVCQHLRTLVTTVAHSLPGAPQIVLLSEPDAGDLGDRDFPLAPEESVDLLSSAMAIVAPAATVGVCGGSDVDVALLLEAGPEMIAFPASHAVVPLAGQLDRFLSNGGWVAWGAVATGGPIGVTARRSWLHLQEVWSELASRGCSPDRLREQCLLTPDGALLQHNPLIAERICRSVRDVSSKLRSVSPLPPDHRR